MGLAGALNVAPTIPTIKLLDKGLINLMLKGGRKAHGLILEATITGSEDCFQIVAFTSSFLMVCWLIQLDEIQCLVQSRQSTDSLPIMGNKHWLKSNEPWLFDSQVIGVTRVDT